jgi:hypothetical protein
MAEMSPLRRRMIEDMRIRTNCERGILHIVCGSGAAGVSRSS